MIVSLFDLQIENHKLYFREQAQSKCGSLDYFNHIPGGGDKKVVYLMNSTTILQSFKNSQVFRVSSSLLLSFIARELYMPALYIGC